MAQSSINGFAINAASASVLVAATAVILCSAGITAEGAKLLAINGNVSGTVSIVANGEVCRKGYANILGSGELYGKATQTFAGSATVTGNANIVSYVLRSVEAESFIVGSANLQVIPASLLGESNFLSTAEISADLTLVHRAYSGITGTAGVTFPIESVLTRYVTSEGIQGNAQVYCETTINNVHETYANIVCSANLETPDSGIVFRIAECDIINSAECVAIDTYKHSASANIVANSNLGTAEAYLSLISVTNFDCSANLIAEAIRVVQATAVILPNTTNIVASATQKHSGVCPITGGVTITPSCTRVTQGYSNLAGSCGIVSDGIREVIGEATIYGEASLVGIEEIWSIIVLAASDIPATVSVTGSIDVMRIGFSNIEGECSIIADTIANPTSYDPPWRTFIRPTQVTEFIRPVNVKDFRRSA